MSKFDEPNDLVPRSRLVGVTIAAITIAAIFLGVIVGLLVSKTMDVGLVAQGTQESTASNVSADTGWLTLAELQGEELRFAIPLHECSLGIWYGYSKHELYYDEARNSYTDPNSRITHKEPHKDEEAIKRTRDGYVFRTKDRRFSDAKQLQDDDPKRDSLVAVKIVTEE